MQVSTRTISLMNSTCSWSTYTSHSSLIVRPVAVARTSHGLPEHATSAPPPVFRARLNTSLMTVKCWRMTLFMLVHRSSLSDTVLTVFRWLPRDIVLHQLCRFTSFSRTAFSDYCPDRFFWATWVLFFFFFFIFSFLFFIPLIIYAPLPIGAGFSVKSPTEIQALIRIREQSVNQLLASYLTAAPDYVAWC